MRVILFIIFILFFSCPIKENKVIEKSIKININNTTDYNSSCEIAYPFYDDKDSSKKMETISFYIPSHTKESIEVKAKWLTQSIFFVYIEEEYISISAKDGKDKYFYKSYTITSETSSINVDIIF